MEKARLSVLLIDDDERHLAFYQRLLEKHQWSCETAASGIEGINRLEELATNGFPDVVVVDMKMPGMDGAVAVKKIKDRWPNLCVVVFTGEHEYQDSEHRYDLINRGADEYLEKPVKEKDFIFRLQFAYQRKRSIEEKRWKEKEEQSPRIQKKTLDEEEITPNTMLLTLTRGFIHQIGPRLLTLSFILKSMTKLVQKKEAHQLIKDAEETLFRARECMRRFGESPVNLEKERESGSTLIKTTDENRKLSEKEIEAILTRARGFTNQIDSQLSTLSSTLERIENLTKMRNVRQLIGSAHQNVKYARQYAKLFQENPISLKKGEKVNIVKQVEVALEEVVKRREFIHEDTDQFKILKNGFDSTFWMDGNGDLIREGFVNLFDNAFQAMNEKDKILQVSIQKAQEGRVKVKIKDSGHGISEDNLKRIGEPFFTTKKGKGKGIGLYFTRKIIEEQHAGELHVESDGLKGTTVTVLLPVASPDL